MPKCKVEISGDFVHDYEVEVTEDMTDEQIIDAAITEFQQTCALDNVDNLEGEIVLDDDEEGE